MHHDISLKLRSTLLLGTITLLTVTVCSCARQDSTPLVLDQANRYYENGELDKAEIEYKNVLQKDGQNVQAITRLGLIFHEQGRDARSGVLLLKAKELQPNNLTARLKLGLAYLAAGSRKEAREEAVFVLEQQPTDGQAPLLLIEASTTAEEFEDAKQRLLALPQPARDGAPVLVALGHIALRQNRIKDAEKGFKDAQAADPKYASAHTALGMYYWGQKNLAGAETELKQAAQLSPPRSPQRLHYAQFKIQTGDIAAGRVLLEEISAQTPDYLPAWVWLAELAAADKKWDEADTFVGKALSRDPVHPEALLLNARIRLARGESEKAVNEFERMLTLFPKSPQVSYHLGLAHIARGETAKAIARLSQAIAATPDLVPAVLALGELHVRMRNHAAAISLLQPFVQRRPDVAGAQIILAEAYRGDGNLDAAMALYSKLEEQIPQEPRIAFARALIHIQQKQPAAARPLLHKVREISPGHYAALEQLVNLDLAEKNFAAARKLIEADLKLQPESAQHTFLLARVCLAQEDTAGGEAALRKTIELQPNSAAAHYQLAQLYEKTNQHEKAIENLQATVRQNPNNYSALLLLGVLSDDRKNHAVARDCYEKALALEPKSTLALNNLAYLYSEHFDQLDKAVELAQRARAVLSDDDDSRARVSDTLGWALIKKKQTAQALPLLQESSAKLPNEPEVQYHLGVAHYLAGDETQARNALQRAIALNRAFPGIEDARQRLAVLQIDAGKPAADTRALLEKRIAERADDTVALVRLGALAQQQKQPDKAVLRYKAALQHNPTNPTANIGLARAYAAQKDLPKAIEAAKAARNAAPGDLAITHMVGRLAYDTGDHRWAASLLQEVARQKPKDADVLFDWAEAAYSVGRVNEAESNMRRALDIGTARSAEAQRFLDMVALSTATGAKSGAAGEIEQVLKADPFNAPALMALGSIQEKKADSAAARQTYEKILSRYPEFSPAQKQLTLLYAAQPGEQPNAVALANKARQAFPEDTALTRAAGIIAFRQGDFARAASLLQETESKFAKDSELLYYLGMAQFRLNKRVESKQTLERALEAGLKEPLAAQARKSIAGS